MKHREPVHVTKTFMPPIDEYVDYLKKIWTGEKITNQGPLLKELEAELARYSESTYRIHYVSNGTVALQLAIRALELNGTEIITTPFSYVATTSAILWENCTPKFVDINRDTFCIDVDKIEAAITKKTKAILAVHVYGNPCDVYAINKIAKKHKLKVIYDAAHAFGEKLEDKSMMDFGDISITSFHATKVFHTVEGGALFVRDKAISDKVELIKRFGHDGDRHYMLGINAKNSEFHAAMGLVNIKYIKDIIKARKALYARYDDKITNKNIQKNIRLDNLHRNYAYYPVVFKDIELKNQAIEAMEQRSIYPRRYFFPSLDQLSYLSTDGNCPISSYVSDRVLCLPLYPQLEESRLDEIARIVNGE